MIVRTRRAQPANFEHALIVLKWLRTMNLVPQTSRYNRTSTDKMTASRMLRSARDNAPINVLPQVPPHRLRVGI